ncbi:hypothetical protein N836_28110 [Leptolyngbya sp. Heron Island J]|uniref:hypothetical protein n=1 Tax=Leptolyngbya sp. Heron Island J TaxID=1385935 RepID=UPI0003B9A3DC|nr:hypothetical protein [Leptolyngbya sp. Heron Island J]ESA32021.1 hypothetical protein N836_28110 [Leptolyngbya sp. Heron Island J]
MMASENHGFIISGDAKINIGNVAVGKGAKVENSQSEIHSASENAGKSAQEDFEAALQELVAAIELHQSAIQDKDDIIQLIQTLSEEVHKGTQMEKPNKFTLKALFREVKESLGSVVEITGQIGNLQTAINALIGIALL